MSGDASDQISPIHLCLRPFARTNRQPRLTPSGQTGLSPDWHISSPDSSDHSASTSDLWGENDREQAPDHCETLDYRFRSAWPRAGPRLALGLLSQDQSQASAEEAVSD